MLKDFYGSTNNNEAGLTKSRIQAENIKNQYKDFKNNSQISKVPFSPL
jgi:hypothetical protein